MPFDRAAYMRDYRAAKRDGKPTNIRGGMSRKDSPSLSGDTETTSAKTETQEPGASPWVPLVALLLFVVVIVAVFWFSSRSNEQEDDEKTA